ncbi:hypothetical protein PWT90_07044 [Aphanocladium album]|nr:hypothetical protein PWT90_07044 [Aphanocladium album]
MSTGRQSQALPDIVRDSKLEAEIFSTYTKNVLYLSKPGVRQRQRIEERWVRENGLGHGAYGIVHLERCDTGDNPRLRAVKQIRKVIMPGTEFDYAAELEAIMKFSHPNYRHCFVHSYGWYESNDCVFIAMEYLEHGDLQRHLARPLPEHEARLIATQVLEGLRYMHENGFTHRDLKPGNILVVTPGPDWGSLGFAAPEALGDFRARGSYTSTVDMWSLGAVIYTMLTGTTPFANLQDVFLYASGHFKFPIDVLQKASITQNGQQFITALMEPDGRKRLSSKNADKHPWMTTPLAIITGIADIGLEFLCSHYSFALVAMPFLFAYTNGSCGSGDTITSVASASWSTLDENPTEKASKNRLDTTGKSPTILAAKADKPAYQPPSVEECLDRSGTAHGRSLPKDSTFVLDNNTLVPGGPILRPNQGPQTSNSDVQKPSADTKPAVSPQKENPSHVFGPRTSRPYASQGDDIIAKYNCLSVSDSELPNERKTHKKHNRSASTSELPCESADSTRLKFPSTDRETRGDFDNAAFSDTSSNCSSSGRCRSSADFKDGRSVLLFEEVKKYRERLAWAADKPNPTAVDDPILIDPEVNRLWDEGYVRENDKPGPDDKFILYLLRHKLISSAVIMEQITLLTGFYYEPKEKKGPTPSSRIHHSSSPRYNPLGPHYYSPQDRAEFERAREYLEKSRRYREHGK